MEIKADDSPLERLFRLNRTVPTTDVYARTEEIERPWIGQLLADVAAGTTPVASRAEWIQRLDALLESERAGSVSSRYLAEQGTHQELRSYVRGFATDGRTEAQNLSTYDLTAGCRVSGPATDDLAVRVQR